MREGWTIRTIGEVALHLCDGSHNPPVGIDFSKYPMLSSKNIFFDSYDYSEPRYLTKEQFDIENKRTNVSDGDILLTIVGTIGRVCCIKEPFQPFTLQRSVAVIKPNKNIIISRYLMYCLCGLNAYFNKEAKGVAQKGIYLKQLSKISIPVPPLQEQERIVAELDLLTEIIDKQKQQLKELDTLAQSIFYDMFGNPNINDMKWDYSTFKSIFKLKSGDGLIGKNFMQGNYPVYGGNGISGYHNKYNKDGDYIIVGRVGAYCGNVRYVKGQFWLTDNAFQALFDNTVLDYVFVCYLLNAINLHQYANQAAQPVISNVVLKDIQIIMPPKTIQREFAKKIQTIESQKESINRSIAESQKLFDYTMDKYFG